MQVLRELQKFNTVALSVLLVFAFIAAAFIAVRTWQSESAGVSGPNNNQARTGNEIAGQRIRAGNKLLTLYNRTRAADDFSTDLRFVNSQTGEIASLGQGPEQQMYGGSVMGPVDRDRIDSGYGYFVLAKTGERQGEPLFDVLFLRFSDMRIFTIASNALAADETELDAGSFSAVLWDSKGSAKFILFDVQQGEIVVSKELNMQGTRKTSSKSVAAPLNRFGQEE